jgi:hypothetical protein
MGAGFQRMVQLILLGPYIMRTKLCALEVYEINYRFHTNSKFLNAAISMGFFLSLKFDIASKSDTLCCTIGYPTASLQV